MERLRYGGHGWVVLVVSRRKLGLRAAFLVAAQLTFGCGGRTDALVTWNSSGGATELGGTANGGQPAALGGRLQSGGSGASTGGSTVPPPPLPPPPPPSLSTWYVYADGFGSNGLAPGECQLAGHSDSQCSMVLTPTPSPSPFPISAAPLCTVGIAAQVTLGFEGGPDYGHIWGGGIGLDFTSNGVRMELNAPASRVVGVSFTIDSVPTGLRVEFPTGTRDPKLGGWDYWGASSLYPPSPVKTGPNQVLFREIHPPLGGIFDPSQLTGIQFHVSTAVLGPNVYSFCISNLSLIVN